MPHTPSRCRAWVRVVRFVVVAGLAGLSALLFSLAGLVVVWSFAPYPAGWAVGSSAGALLAVSLVVGAYLLGRGDGYTDGWRDGYDQRDGEPSPGFEATADDVAAMWEQVNQVMAGLTESVEQVSAAADALEVPTVAGRSRLVQAAAVRRRRTSGEGSGETALAA